MSIMYHEMRKFIRSYKKYAPLIREHNKIKAGFGSQRKKHRIYFVNKTQTINYNPYEEDLNMCNIRLILDGHEVQHAKPQKLP